MYITAMAAADIARGFAIAMAAGLAVCMLYLARDYWSRRDDRWALAVGYASAMAYVVVVQIHLWDEDPTWRTILAIASSLVGWWAVERIIVHGRRD